MTISVLFIHGGGGEAYKADEKLADSLQEMLGPHYNVIYPKMPNANHPEYGTWKAQISKELAALEGRVILVGHSLGGSIFLKYLSEEGVEISPAGLFVIAAPYWGAEDWEVDEYVLSENFASHLPGGLPIFFYHGRGDEIVPFEHLAMYAAKLPQAHDREFDGRGHQFNNDLSEVAADILALQKR